MFSQCPLLTGQSTWSPATVSLAPPTLCTHPTSGISPPGGLSAGAAHSPSPGMGAAVLGAFSRGESLVPNSEF